MNEGPPSQIPPDDVADHYRRVSALDPSRPGENVRRAVLDRAAELAAERARGNEARKRSSLRWPANQRWRQTAIFGTLAAAALAGLMVVPRLLPPRTPATAAAPVQGKPAAGAISAEGAAQRRALDEPPTPAPEIAERVVAPAASTPSGDISSHIRSARPQAPAPASGSSAPPAEKSLAPSMSLQRSADHIATDLAAGQRAAPAAALAERGLPTAPSAGRTSGRGSVVGGLAGAASLRHAAEAGDLATLELLLAKRVDVDSRDSLGRTALMLATLHGQIDAVAVLLARGADPNAADVHGTTPLQAAEAQGEPRISAMLERFGAR